MGSHIGLVPSKPTQSNREIFLAALAVADGPERQAFLRQACGGDPQRRDEIERLLAACDSEVPNPLDRVIAQLEPDETWGVETTGSLELDIAKHPIIDRYKLLQQIGEGGMGLVFMAQQTEPIQRKVALKLIKPGMDSREVLARFQAEQQVLAMMDHPHIAQVLDAGTTAEGHPYFVMELVCGVPITDYCDQQRLAISDRLRLLVDVCRAVQHAHQKGIIHRDLKPSNVMVTLQDGAPVVKVIDFGVAKALNPEMTGRAVFTHFAQVVGTPLYMSPEQAERSGVDIDTRSDIYSLGVLLYELLTGTTPFEKESLANVGFDGMRRIIRENDPPRPSTRIGSFPYGHLEVISKNRRVQPKTLVRVLRGELEWIVMKSLERDRSRRYDSASALARDIERYLRGEPVQACPPSALYRLRKLTQRHRGLLSAAVLALSLMLIGLVVSSKLAIRAFHAEQTARSAQQEAEDTAEEMRNLLYASDVMLASQAGRHNDIRQARERLARHIPKPGQRDLRGFEWHYLWKQQDVAGVEIANLGSAVYDLALSADGSLLAAAGADAVIHLFQGADGAPYCTIDTQQGETNGVDFSPDSPHIAATGDDGTLRVWNLDTLRELWSVRAHEGLAYQVRYSPSGKILATCGVDHSVRLWDAATGASLGTLNQHRVGIETIAISSTGLVAAGDRSARFTLWNLEQTKEIWTVDDSVFDPVSSVVFSDHGYLAYGTLGGLLTIVDVRRRAVVSQRRFAEGIQSLAFGPLGAWLAVGDRGGHLRIVPFEHGAWDLRSAREWPAHDARVYALAVTSDGKRILSGGADGRIMAWEPLTEAAEQTLRFTTPFTKITDMDGARFVISGDNQAMLCDQTGTVLGTIASFHGGDIAVAATVRHVFGVRGEEVGGWNLDTGEPFFHWSVRDNSQCLTLAVTPDGLTLCVTVLSLEGSRTLRIVDVSSGKILEQLTVRSAHHLAISADGRWLAFDADNDIQQYDLVEKRLANRWRAHQASIRGLQFSRDGRRLGSISADRTLKLWALPGGQLEYSAIAHLTDTVDLAISPDGQRIATAGKDRMLRIWDGQSASPLLEYTVVAGRILDLCFSADGQHLLCLCNEHNVLILDGAPSLSE